MPGGGSAAETAPFSLLRPSRCAYSFLRMLKNAPLTIAGRQFQSRLITGTGKFSSPETMRDALLASGTQMVTVALRRADLSGKKDPFANILEFIDPDRYLLLPNTSGAMNAEEAVRLSRLAGGARLAERGKAGIHPQPRSPRPGPGGKRKAAPNPAGGG